MKVTLYYSQFLQVLQMNPEIQRYKKQILGRCCAPPEDDVLKSRIKGFLTLMPEFKAQLEPLT